MSEQGQYKEELFNFKEQANSVNDQNSIQTASIPIEQMNDQYIQAEITAVVSSSKTQQFSRDKVSIPPIEYLEDDFQLFTENKSYSFLLLSFHPYFRDKFDQNDIKQIASQTKQRGQYVSYLNIISILGIYSGCEHLFKSRAIFGLTYNSGFLGMFFRYYLVPKLITNMVDQFVFYPNLQKKTNNILSKYSFDSEIKSNPLYKKAFEDFKLYKIQEKSIRIQPQPK